ncbi:MAG: PEP-CTERM sorting domain-containing protein [Pirellulales bacterium]
MNYNGIVNAVLTIGGGTVTIGQTSGSSIRMATATVAGTFVHEAHAELHLIGGSTTLAGDIVRVGGAGISSAVVRLGGGSLDMSGKAIGAAVATIDFRAESGRLANLGELNAGGMLTKTTGGTLILAGTSAYSGATQVSAGQVVLAPSSALTMTPAITVAAGATLSGEGTVAGKVSIAGETTSGAANGGTLSPGTTAAGDVHGIGTLTMTSAAADALTLGAGSTFVFEFRSAYATSAAESTLLAGTDWDFMSIAGTLQLAGPVRLSLFAMTDELQRGLNAGSVGPAFNPSQSTTDAHRWLFAETSGITLMNGGDLDDYFTFDTAGVFGAGLYSNALGGSFWVSQDGNDLYVNYAAVPEPGSLALVAVATLGGYIHRRRRRNRRGKPEANAV